MRRASFLLCGCVLRVLRKHTKRNGRLRSVRVVVVVQASRGVGTPYSYSYVFLGLGTVCAGPAFCCVAAFYCPAKTYEAKRPPPRYRVGMVILASLFVSALWENFM